MTKAHKPTNTSTEPHLCGDDLAACVEYHIARYIANLGDATTHASVYNTALRVFDQATIRAALMQCNNNKTHAAQLLGINRNSLRKKLAQEYRGY